MGDIVKAKRFLLTYREAYNRYIKILEKIDKVRTTSPKSPDLSGMPHSGTPSDLGDRIAEMETLITGYRAQLDMLGEQMGKVRDAIEKLFGKDQLVISFKYIDFLTFSQIAMFMDESVDAVYKRHQRALERIEVDYAASWGDRNE